MRIYSNSLLTWPLVVHLSQVARFYPGRCHNYYIYRITFRDPLILKTYSPLEILQENMPYYCYNRFYRDKRLESFGNVYEIANATNLEETWVHIPRYSVADDILIVKSDMNYAIPGLYISSLFKTPDPALS